MSVNGEGDGNNVNTPISVNVTSPEDFGASELARIGEQYNRVPFAVRDMRRRRATAIRQLNSIGEDTYEAAKASVALTQQVLDNPVRPLTPEEKKLARREIKSQRQIISIYENALKTVNSLDPRLAAYETTTAERLNTQAVNAVNREFADSRINSFVSGIVNDQGIQTAGLAMASQASFMELAQRRKSILNQISGIRTRSLEAASQLIGPEGVNEDAQRVLNEGTAQIKELAAQLAPIAAAMKTQRQLGLDPESKQGHFARLEQKAQSVLDFDALQKQIAQGKGEYGNLTAAELKQKETEAASNLIKALDELRRSAGASDEVLTKLNKQVEEAAEKFEEVRQAGAAGAGGRGSGWALTAAYASAAGQAAALVGTGIQILGINHPMQQLTNAGGWAAIENYKHDSWRAAIAGNMKERLNLVGWASAHEFGNRMADAAAWKVSADITGGTSATIAGVAQTAEVVKNAVGAQTIGTILGNSETVTQAAQGILATGEGALMTAAGISDAARHLSTGRANIAGVNLSMDVVSKLNHVKGYQLQAQRDHLMGLYMPSVQMGLRRGEAFVNEAGSSSFVERMLQFGLGSKQFSDLSNFGVQNMGSMFDANQVLQAKRFENLAMGTAEEHMQRMAALSLGGTQNPSQSYEKMLERAFTVGLDSSKALNMIAESTGALAEQSAMAGFAGLSEQIGSHIMSAIDRNNPNQGFASKQAINVYQAAEQIRNNRSASFHGMVAVSRLQKELGIDWETAQALQGMSVDQLQSLRGKSDDEIRKALFWRGIDTDKFSGRLSDVLTTVINSKAITHAEANGGMATGAANAFANVVMPWLRQDRNNASMLAFGDPDSWPKEIRDAILGSNWVAQGSNMDARAVLRERLAGMGLLTPDDMISFQEGLTSDIGGSLGHMQREFNRQYTQGGRAIIAGALGDGSGRDNIAQLAYSGDAVQNMLGPSAEERWAEAAAKSAEDFGASATQLNSASSKLDKVADKLLIVVNELADRRRWNENLPERLGTGASQFARFGE